MDKNPQKRTLWFRGSCRLFQIFTFTSVWFPNIFAIFSFPPSQCPFLKIFVQKLFFIQKAVNLSSKSLLALTKQVSTCFEDFMNISWFYLIKVKFSGHFWPYTLSAPSCTWFLMIGMLVGLKLFIISWVWVHICAPVKFLTFFPTWASNRNLIF